MPNNLSASTLIVTMSTHHFPNAVSTEEVVVKKTTTIHIVSHKIHNILTYSRRAHQNESIES